MQNAFLNEGGKYKCLYVNVEAGQAERENIDGAVRAILTGLASNARIYHEVNGENKHQPVYRRKPVYSTR